MMNKLPTKILLLAGSLMILSGCSDKEQADEPVDITEHLSGGQATVTDASSHAFSLPIPGLSSGNLSKHIDGDAAFEQSFVTAPSPVFGGLGPIYNNTSCVNCHIRDGRGKAPFPGEVPSSLLLRASVSGTESNGEPKGAPGFGGQIQHRAVAGVPAETDIIVSYQEVSGKYGDGTPFSLRKPVYSLVNPYADLPAGLEISPRITPPVFGLGLIDALEPSTILAHADPFDANSDGISGKPNYVFNAETGLKEIGKYGWKAGTPTVLHQTAGAFNQDMGITSPLFPVESSSGQPQEPKKINAPEISQDFLELTAFYVKTLAVPARRNVKDVTVKKGENQFKSLNCVSCHVPEMKTGFFPDIPQLSNQMIRPYSDVLLHDMGSELADNRPEFDATGTEWRTPPLWGIGLTEVVGGTPYYLHDGRARTLEEAILWHGGEAEKSSTGFKQLPKTERDALIAFLKSL